MYIMTDADEGRTVRAKEFRPLHELTSRIFIHQENETASEQALAADKQGELKSQYHLSD